MIIAMCDFTMSITCWVSRLFLAFGLDLINSNQHRELRVLAASYKIFGSSHLEGGFNRSENAFSDLKTRTSICSRLSAIYPISGQALL